MSANFIQQNNLINISEYPNTFVRQGAFPLERFSVFETLESAENYAKNDPRAYIGQQLVVVESETSTPSSFVISGTGGALVRMADTYDLTSASDNITGKLDEHEQVAATSSVYGHVKLSTNDTPGIYGSIAVNSDGQLVSVAATSSTLGVSKACSRIGQTDASSQHVIGIDANKCIVLNIAKNHSGFDIIGEETPVIRGQKTVLKVNTGTYPLSENYHPTHDTETSRVITDNLGQLAVYPASANWYGAVKIGTDLSLNDYSRVPNCSSVNTAINTSIQGLSGTVDGKFLPLSGGTITGSITISGKSNYVEQLVFGGSAEEAGLKVRGISGRLHGTSDKSSLFINYDGNDVPHDEYWSYDTDNGRGMFICGNGNDSLAVRKKDLIAYSSELSSTINSKIYNEYLPLSGGTMRGNVYYGNDREENSEQRPDLILIQGPTTNNKSRLIFKEGGWKDQVHLFATYADVGGVDDNNKFHIATAVGTQGSELNTDPTPRMTILFGSGNVGIGTQTPQTKLHVDGDIKSTSLSATSGYIDDTLYIKNKINFPESIIIGNNINTSKSGIIQIRAHNSSDESVFGYSSLLIDDSGITITHSSSDNDGSLTSSPQSVTIQANTLDKLNHIDSIVTSGSTNLIESKAVYDYLHGDTISLGLATDTPSGTIELIAGDINGLYNKLSVTSDGLTLSHPISSLDVNNDIVYIQDEVSVTAEDLKRLKHLETLKSTMVVREWDYTSTLPETTMTNNTMMIFRNWDLEQNDIDLELIDEKLETI